MSVDSVPPGAKESYVNLRRLRYFARIVEAGSITRAAEQLFVAQPALGLQIRQLEQSFGVSLLIRHSRGVSPTGAGQLLYERACEVLRLIDDTERAVMAVGRHEGEQLVVGMTNGMMSLVGREIVMRARKELPAIRLNLVEERSGALMDSLEREELDVAIAYDAHERPGLLRVPLLIEEPLFVCAPRSASGESIEFVDLITRSLVVPGPRDVVRRRLDAAARELALSLNVTLEISSISARKSLVEHGDAATIMAYGSVAAEVASGRLATQRIVNPTIRRTLYLARSLRRAEFKHEGALLDVLGEIVHGFCLSLGELAQPLPALARPLSEAVAEAASGAAEDDASLKR
jgi:LysR family nitrogen assimilation transcriptional regulator